MQSGGSPCVYVVLRYSSSSGLPGAYQWEPKAVFSSFLWFSDLVSGFVWGYCLSLVHWRLDTNRRTEYRVRKPGFNLLDFCFGCPVPRIKLISRSSWEWIFPLRLFVRDFLCLPLLSIQEVILEALLQALWPQPLHSLAFSSGTSCSFQSVVTDPSFALECSGIQWTMGACGDNVPEPFWNGQSVVTLMIPSDYQPEVLVLFWVH